MHENNETVTTTARSVGPSRRWTTLLVMLLAVFMELMDGSIVNVAIPHIKQGLGVSDLGMQWAVAGYVLAYAVFIVTGGRLGDLIGRRSMFLVGVAGFTLTSALCGVAWAPGVLIMARLVQGASAAVMVPQVLAMLQELFPADERGKPLAAFSTVSGLATVAGPLVSAVLLDSDPLGLGWRAIFLINVPVGVVVTLAALALVPQSSGQPTTVDFTGVLIATAALLLLLYPLTLGQEIGWPVWTFVMMLACVPAGWLFVRHERHVQRGGGVPVVAINLFRDRTFVVGMVISFVLYAAFSGPFFVMSLFFQFGLGFTPLEMAVTVLPWTVGVPLGATVASAVLVPRFGRRTLTMGAAMMVVGFAGLAALVAHGGYTLRPWHPVVVFGLAGLGMGMVVAPLLQFALARTPLADAGSASGIITSMQQIGASTGIAVMGVVFFARLGATSATGGLAYPPAMTITVVIAAVVTAVVWLTTFLLPMRPTEDESPGADNAGS